MREMLTQELSEVLLGMGMSAADGDAVRIDGFDGMLAYGRTLSMLCWICWSEAQAADELDLAECVRS